MIRLSSVTALALTILPVSAYEVRPESEGDQDDISGSTCYDGVDNDGDTLVDLDDPDCLMSKGGRYDRRHLRSRRPHRYARRQRRRLRRW